MAAPFSWDLSQVRINTLLRSYLVGYSMYDSRSLHPNRFRSRRTNIFGARGRRGCMSVCLTARHVACSVRRGYHIPAVFVPEKPVSRKTSLSLCDCGIKRCEKKILLPALPDSSSGCSPLIEHHSLPRPTNPCLAPTPNNTRAATGSMNAISGSELK